MTLLEDIPNEIIVTILSYLCATQAVIGFSKLNSRFENLLREFCLNFDLTSIGKNNFDLVLQIQNTNQWKSLKLSDDNYTPGQVTYFFEKYSFINQFSELQNLSLIGLEHRRSDPIFTQLPSLVNLVSLEIKSVCEANIPEIDLPNLKKLKFSSCSSTNWLAVRT